MQLSNKIGLVRKNKITLEARQEDTKRAVDQLEKSLANVTKDVAQEAS